MGHSFTEAMALEEVGGFVYVMRTVVAQKVWLGIVSGDEIMGNRHALMDRRRRKRESFQQCTKSYRLL